MAIYIKKRGVIESAPTYVGAVAGDVISAAHVKVAAVANYPLGLLFEDVATAPFGTKQLCVAGEGSIIEDDAAAFTVGGKVFSDGDGTYSQIKPAVGGWSIGVARSATEFTVQQEQVEA